MLEVYYMQVSKLLSACEPQMLNVQDHGAEACDSLHKTLQSLL